MSEHTRRSFLTVAGIGGAAAIGGCIGAPRTQQSVDQPEPEPEPSLNDAKPVDVDRELYFGQHELYTDTNTNTKGDPASAVTVEPSSRPAPTIEPAIVHIEPGGIVEWVGTGIRNTVSAYHPETHGPLRMPDAAALWVSKMLYEEQTYAVTIETEGVYDYADTVVLCGTHESFGARPHRRW